MASKSYQVKTSKLLREGDPAVRAPELDFEVTAKNVDEATRLARERMARRRTEKIRHVSMASSGTNGSQLHVAMVLDYTHTAPRGKLAAFVRPTKGNR